MNLSSFFKKEIRQYKNETFSDQDLAEFRDMVINKINKRLAAKDHKRLAEALSLGIGIHLDRNAKNRILNGDLTAWKLIEQQTCWMAHMIRRVEGSIFMDSRNFGGIIGMAMLWGYDELADIIAREAERHFLEDKKKFATTQAIHVFMISLYHKYRNGKMPEFFNILPADHVYQRLISHWRDEAAFPIILREACDYHLQSAYDDGKDKMMEILTFDLVPFDIRCIGLVRKKEGLSTPAVDHPLLNTPLAAIPSERPGYDPGTDEIFQLVLRNE